MATAVASFWIESDLFTDNSSNGCRGPRCYMQLAARHCGQNELLAKCAGRRRISLGSKAFENPLHRRDGRQHRERIAAERFECGLDRSAGAVRHSGPQRGMTLSELFLRWAGKLALDAV